MSSKRFSRLRRYRTPPTRSEVLQPGRAICADPVLTRTGLSLCLHVTLAQIRALTNFIPRSPYGSRMCAPPECPLLDPTTRCSAENYERWWCWTFRLTLSIGRPTVASDSAGIVVGAVERGTLHTHFSLTHSPVRQHNKKTHPARHSGSATTVERSRARMPPRGRSPSTAAPSLSHPSRWVKVWCCFGQWPSRQCLSLLRWLPVFPCKMAAREGSRTRGRVQLGVSSVRRPNCEAKRCRQRISPPNATLRRVVHYYV